MQQQTNAKKQHSDKPQTQFQHTPKHKQRKQAKNSNTKQKEQQETPCKTTENIINQVKTQDNSKENPIKNTILLTTNRRVTTNPPAFLAIRLLSLTEHLSTVYLGEVLVCAARMRDGKPEDWHELYEDEDGPQIKKEAEWFLKKFPNMLPRLTEDGEKVWLPP